MKILILGAGQVGSTLARYLCLDDDNDITIVDQKEEMLTSLQRHLDIKTVVGYGAYPSVLEKAGIKSMDMVIAVMNSDERNMVATMFLSSEFITAMTMSMDLIPAFSKTLGYAP